MIQYAEMMKKFVRYETGMGNISKALKLSVKDAYKVRGIEEVVDVLFDKVFVPFEFVVRNSLNIAEIVVLCYFIPIGIAQGNYASAANLGAIIAALEGAKLLMYNTIAYDLKRHESRLQQIIGQ